MPRKETPSRDRATPLHGVIGVILLGLACFYLAALFSHDPTDLNSEPPAPRIHNWVGKVGAYLANGSFFLFGAAAYLLPIILAGLALSQIFQWLSYLRRRWPWALVLLLAGAGMMDLYSSYLTSLSRNLNAPAAGGIVGVILGEKLFARWFGTAGSAILFGTIYAISLILLTNFNLIEWLRERWRRRQEAAQRGMPSEKTLEKRARELDQQARKIREQVEKSGLGADLKPVPEPTVRDLSVPKAGARTSGEGKLPGPPAEGEVITAQEIAQEAAPGGKAPPAKAPPAEPVETKAADGSTDAAARSGAAAKVKAVPKKPKPIAVAATPMIGNYKLPSLGLLNYPDLTTRPTESREELMANARLMQNTLAQFEIEVALGDITKGPTITRYELHPAPGVRLEKIVALSNNIAAALKAERIHILAPVPGKSSVGVEVPNVVKTKVIMRDLLESDEWLHTKARIPLALGKDVYGQPIIADLSEMPHLLIAGSTGSGKSVCINCIIASLLFRFSPDQLRFVMIDPKVVELQQYNALPHLVVPVVNDPKKVILALRWVVNEMEKRYQIFARVGVRNIKSFNERPKNKPLPQFEPEPAPRSKKEKGEHGGDGFAVELDEEITVPREEEIIIPEKLSYIVVIIDELADLMLVAPADVEMAIARITQMARAAGIHCIVATQRPSVDVITGVIKANIPARIAFQVAAKVDSRTILDAMGADKLLGKGDMLYLPPGSAKLTRAQGALITDQEIQSLVDFIAGQGKPSYEVEIHQQLSKPVASDEEGSECDEDEGLIQQCIEVIRSEQKASVSLMQRRLRLGYTRAARIMDELERRGIVGPGKGAEPRDILIDLDTAQEEAKGAGPA